ncbi:hypothetical protein MLD38_008960 [Melastoma candidum]|uniref:Uncharacterized protein n=1 Tax=Melastoma candidum TaxID=119954 RepID=A0ACB9RW03_9MYRT|nr:hypothetical protein MLD38_008960 [Melastoma candidum]
MGAVPSTRPSSTSGTILPCRWIRLPHSAAPPELPPPKGTEAPRNSLELEQPPFQASTHYKRDYGNLNIPMGIQIRTSSDRSPTGSIQESSPEVDSSSTGNRTPTLVARLMGLDILPASCSSSPRLSSTMEVTPPYSDRRPDYPHNRTRTLHAQQGPRRSWGSDMDAMNCSVTRSLPETPRVSLARRSTESTTDHRLSLQIINRENSNSTDEFDLSRFRTLLRRKEAKLREQEENRSPSHSPLKFIKPATDKVGRKVGVDITNMVKNRERDRRDREILVNHFKSKQESSLPSSSPKVCAQNSNQKNRSFIVDVPKLQILEEEQKATQPKCSRRCKKPAIIVDERFDSRLKKPVRDPQEETSIFARRLSPSSRAKSSSDIPERKCRKACPLPAKKDPSPPATKIPQKQQPQQQVCDSASPTWQSSTLQSSDSSNSLLPGETRNLVRDHARPKEGGDWSEEWLNFYVSRVLDSCSCYPEERDIISPSIDSKQHSESHALDPSMFHLIELETNLEDLTDCQLRHKWNRKLLFDLLGEIISDIQSRSARHNGGSRSGRVIAREVCGAIRSSPPADCQYLEDIDGLIEGDMARSKGYPEEDGVGLAQEIEEDIMEKLLRETAMACGVTFT